MNWQVFDAFGIFLGYTANLIVSQTGTRPVSTADGPTLTDRQAHPGAGS